MFLPGSGNWTWFRKLWQENWNKVLIKGTWKWKFNDVPLSKHVITKLIKHWRTILFLYIILFFSTKKLPNRNLNKRLNWKGDPSILKFVFSPMLLKWMAARFIEAFCSWSLFLRFLSYFRGIVDTRVLSN